MDRYVYVCIPMHVYIYSCNYIPKNGHPIISGDSPTKTYQPLFWRIWPSQKRLQLLYLQIGHPRFWLLNIWSHYDPNRHHFCMESFVWVSCSVKTTWKKRHSFIHDSEKRSTPAGSMLVLECISSGWIHVNYHRPMTGKSLTHRW